MEIALIIAVMLVLIIGLTMGLLRVVHPLDGAFFHHTPRRETCVIDAAGSPGSPSAKGISIRRSNIVPFVFNMFFTE